MFSGGNMVSDGEHNSLACLVGCFWDFLGCFGDVFGMFLGWFWDIFRIFFLFLVVGTWFQLENTIAWHVVGCFWDVFFGNFWDVFWDVFRMFLGCLWW